MASDVTAKAAAQAPTAGAASFRCSGCGTAYDAASYRALTPLQTLSALEVRAHAPLWPTDRVVEVRACRTCAKPMARSRRRDPA